MLGDAFRSSSIVSLPGVYLADLFCKENFTTQYYDDHKLTIPDHSEHIKSEKTSIQGKFLAVCMNLKAQSKELISFEKKSLHRLFAYCLDEINGTSQKETEKKKMFFCFNMLALYPNLLDSFADLTYILNLVSQQNRAWIKTCIVQALKNKYHYLKDKNSPIISGDERELAQPKKKAEIDFVTLVTSLEHIIKLLHQSVTKATKDTYKKKLFEEEFSAQLAKFDEVFNQLEDLRQQLSIKEKTVLLTKLDELKIILNDFFNSVQLAVNYKSINDNFDTIFQEVLTLLATHKKTGLHNQFLDFLYVSSELSNIGLVLQEVVGGISGSTYWSNIGIEVGHYSNPLIYGLKALQRGFKVIGRRYFGWEFDEDEVGVNPTQDRDDVIAAGIFTVVTGLLIVSAVLSMTILAVAAWAIAPIGLGWVWKSEYGYQNQRAKERLETMEDSAGLFDEEAIKIANKKAHYKKIASNALKWVIVFISLGMLVATLGTIPGFNISLSLLSVSFSPIKLITMISGAMLAGLAIRRAFNFLQERGIKESFKALGNYLISLPKRIGQYCCKIGPRIVEAAKNFMDSSRWHKIAVVLSVASLAVSITALTGGIGLIVGLVIAGSLQFASWLARGVEAYKKKKLTILEAEKAQPITSQEEFNEVELSLCPQPKISRCQTPQPTSHPVKAPHQQARGHTGEETVRSASLPTMRFM